jgi:catechol 2,3-dioxygenase-like lactoylglutathione lyase family enzyme
MENFYARSVFFVEDADRARRFYRDELGFTVDWDVEDVFQVGLFGFELILNQVTDQTRGRAGHGRVYIGLEDDQIAPLCRHIVEKGIRFERQQWGRATLVIRDPDGNELFFWLSAQDDWSGFGLPDPAAIRPRDGD